MDTQQSELESILQKEFLPQQSDNVGAVREIFSDTIEEATNRRSIDLKTDLTDDQCINMAILDWLDHSGMFPDLSVFTHSLKRNLVSRNRLGRKEAVDIFRSVGSSSKRGLFGRLFGQDKAAVVKNEG
jgi:hypothetical protein